MPKPSLTGLPATGGKSARSLGGGSPPDPSHSSDQRVLIGLTVLAGFVIGSGVWRMFEGSGPALLGAGLGLIALACGAGAGRQVRRLYRNERARAEQLAAANRSLAEKEAELQAVLEVIEAVSGSLHPDTVLDDALDRSLKVTGLDAGAVYLLDRAGEELVLAGHRNVPPSLRQAGHRLPVGGSVLGTVVEQGQPRIIADVGVEPRFQLTSSLHADGIGRMSAVAAPLASEGRILGAMTLTSLDGRRVNDRDLRILTAVASSVAGALEKARLHESVRRADEARRMLLARLVAAQEDERARIAADIHDDSIQIMSAVNLRMGIVRRNVTDPEEARGLERLENTVRLAIARLRHLLFELRPPALDQEGLGPALHTCLEQLEQQFGLVGHLENRLTNEPPGQARIVLYRIAQEAMANVRKHARASHVEVILESTDGGARVRVRDDGVGFSTDESDQPEPGHMGLTSMRERAEMAGGWCRVKSAPDSGTEVVAWLPVLETSQSVAS